jgi:hypothetical protein
MGMGMGMGGGGGGFSPELGEAGTELVRTTLLAEARAQNDIWQQVGGPADKSTAELMYPRGLNA